MKIILSFVIFSFLLLGCVQPEVQPRLEAEEIIPIEEQFNDTIIEDKYGCMYNNPPCNESYDCINNTCVMRSGCAYDNPSCGEGYECVNNTCILKVIIRNYCDSSKCASNEICIDDQCLSAPLTLVFINGGFNQTYFSQVVEKDISILINATPLKVCPQQIKVLKLQEVDCADGMDIVDCAKKYYTDFDVALYIHPFGIFNHNLVSSNNKSIFATDCPRAFLHEMGHSVGGFADQYCYNASFNGVTLNPLSDEHGCGYSPTKREYTCPVYGTCWNRVTHENDRLSGFQCFSNEECAEKYHDSDWECVSCFIPIEGTYEWTYCSGFHTPPIFCLGNPNINGDDRSIMGVGGLAFDENEYNILETRLICK